MGLQTKCLDSISTKSIVFLSVAGTFAQSLTHGHFDDKYLSIDIKSVLISMTSGGSTI